MRCNSECASCRRGGYGRVWRLVQPRPAKVCRRYLGRAAGARHGRVDGGQTGDRGTRAFDRTARIGRSTRARSTRADSSGSITLEEAGTKEASWSGPVTRPPAPTVSRTAVADATPATASQPAVLHAASPANPPVQQSGVARSGRDARLAQSDRRSASTASARHKSSLFARMGSFFRRVSYRQHGTGSQQDIYSHP